MKVKEESKNSWLKMQHSKNEYHGIYSYHFMVNKWGNDGNGVKFIFLGYKITVNGDCSHENERCLLRERLAKTNLDSVLKSRDNTLPTKGLYSQSYGFTSSHVQM